MKKNYSVLMSVYYKEKPENLKESIQSILNQTLKSNDIVLICDGPLNEELDEVIASFKNQINVYRFEKNQGLGHALQYGVLKCKNEYIARMDTDDIAREDRCEKELNYLLEHQDISIVGSNVDEFTTNVKEIKSSRIVPENNEEIVKFSKTRNPFNHPTVMFKKSDIIAAGNYKDVRFMQDYFMWIDLLSSGYKGHNIQESLVYMRADENLYKRRSGKTYFKIQKQLLDYMKEKNYITKKQYIKSFIIRCGSSFAPNWLRQKLFKKFMRKEK